MKEYILVLGTGGPHVELSKKNSERRLERTLRGSPSRGRWTNFQRRTQKGGLKAHENEKISILEKPKTFKEELRKEA